MRSYSAGWTAMASSIRALKSSAPMEENTLSMASFRAVSYTHLDVYKRQELADQINQDYAGKAPVLVSVLRGSFVFMADLVRRITLPCTVDFMAVSSYGSGTTSSGQVKIVKDLSEQIEGKDVLVVEDILDSGNTLSYLLKLLERCV